MADQTPAPAIFLSSNQPTISSNGGTGANIYGDVTRMHLSYVLDAVITEASPFRVVAKVGDISLSITGSDMSLNGAGQLNGGTATSIVYSYGDAHGGPVLLSMNIPATPLVSLADWARRDVAQEFFASVLTRNDVLSGSEGSDQIWGYGGDDLIRTMGGKDTILGGAGNDIISSRALNGQPVPGATFLRGDDGNDYILGGSDFDDINGNKGNDTLSGGDGEDWVVGGQNDDLLFGDAAFDIVYGNLGDDTCLGGDGADWVRGGQGNDLVIGGAGNDFMSGDRGDDTIWGGAGADQFNLISGAATDRVMDFKASEGDFVTIEGGLAYTLTFVNGDAVIDVGNGDRMTLVGVSDMTQLGPNWLH